MLIVYKQQKVCTLIVNNQSRSLMHLTIHFHEVMEEVEVEEDNSGSHLMTDIEITIITITYWSASKKCLR